ncbi:hypothetical protein GH825_30530, partial [Bacillus thuringiensis]|nr:hypothetical protein [Bacillus thuringiensis]
NFCVMFILVVVVLVVLFGIFGVLVLFGYLINILMLFVMVLVIGLLVDDVIVVVENVECILCDEGFFVSEVIEKLMGEIFGVLV